MTRKEMLVSIATQSGLSLRRVRKAVFSRAAENKRLYPEIEFYKAFTDANTNWIDRETLGKEKFTTFNAFEVCNFPSGYVVLFYVHGENHIIPTTIGARLWTRHFLLRCM